MYADLLLLKGLASLLSVHELLSTARIGTKRDCLAKWDRRKLDVCFATQPETEQLQFTLFLPDRKDWSIPCPGMTSIRLTIRRNNVLFAARPEQLCKWHLVVTSVSVDSVLFTPSGTVVQQ